MIDRDYLARLVDASPVDYYVSGIDGARVWWPWRMNKAGASENAAGHRRQCDHYVLDSNFKDESVTNADVLDEAVKLDAHAAVLADVYLDCEATVDALLDGVELAENHAFDGTLVLPLQAPHTECYEALAPSVDGLDVWWGVGGVKDASATRKVKAARDFRAAVGPDAHIHGLGFGVTDVLARSVRTEPTLLDSIDNSTAISNAMQPQITSGDEMMSVVAARASARRIEHLRLLTPFAAGGETTTQSGIEAFATDGGTANTQGTEGGPE